MQVHFETASPQARDLRDMAIRRVCFVMRRLSFLVTRVRVRFSDDNGPRGGVDKRCRVELATSGKGLLVVSSTASNWRSAFETALARAARALVRTRQRTRRPVRHARSAIRPELQSEVSS